MKKVLSELVRSFNPRYDLDHLPKGDLQCGRRYSNAAFKKAHRKYLSKFPRHFARGCIYGGIIGGIALGLVYLCGSDAENLGKAVYISGSDAKIIREFVVSSGLLGVTADVIQYCLRSGHRLQGWFQ